MKLVFCGTPEFGVPTLEAVIAERDRLAAERADLQDRLLRAGFSSRAIYKVLREWELPEEVTEGIEERAGDSDSYAGQNDEE